jgi:hypothetical protein
MKYLIGFVLILGLNSVCEAGIIDGPANVRVQPDGKTLFSIEDSAFVDVITFENDWYRISLCGWVDIIDIADNKLKKGTFLTTVVDHQIGSIINPTEIDRILYVSENRARVQISGYTFKSNLRENRLNEDVEIDRNQLGPLIQYYLENEFEKQRESGFRFVSYDLVDVISDTTNINIYLWVFIGSYRIIQDDSLYLNGAGSVAVKLNAVKHKDTYIITGFESPQGGEAYGDSMAKLFPESVRGKLKSVDQKQLATETRQKAKKYYERILGKTLR